MGLSPTSLAYPAYPRRCLVTAWLVVVSFASILTTQSLSQDSTLPALPATPKRPVSDTYHGVTVVDEYRWLENGKDQEVQRWSDAQNRRTRAYLDSLPARPAIDDYLTSLMTSASGRYYD